jgi:hypothetical protein
MEAEITDHIWSIEEIAELLPDPTFGPRGPYKKKNSNSRLAFSNAQVYALRRLVGVPKRGKSPWQKKKKN